MNRHVSQEDCVTSPKEEAALDAFVAFEKALAGEDGNALRTMVFKKAMFSSPAACMKGLENRKRRLKDDFSDKAMREKKALDRLYHALAQIEPQDFSRYMRLLALLKSTEYGWNPKAKDDRLVIFTERIETMRWLKEHLTADLRLSANAVQELHGGMSDLDQQRIVEEFGRDDAPVRALVASDVASEGINLHYLSHRMIHFDIPWSLMVFQQRNGRIDRYGQTREPDIRYCHSNGIFSYVHPNTVFDEAGGGRLRRFLYPRLRLSVRMENEYKLFHDVGNAKTFCVSIFGNCETLSFDWIVNVFHPQTIDECFDACNAEKIIPGLKDSDDNWNLNGHPDRVIQIDQKLLSVFARTFDDNCDWREARLPLLHVSEIATFVQSWTNYPTTVETTGLFHGSTMWPETGAQEDHIDIAKALDPTAENDEVIISVPASRIATGEFGRDIRIDLSTPEKEFEQKRMPLNLILDSTKWQPWQSAYYAYYQYAPDVTKEFMDFTTRILIPVSQYQMPVIVLDMTTTWDFRIMVSDNVVINAIHTVRENCDDTTQNGTLTESEAMQSLEALHKLTAWFGVRKGILQEEPPFIPPKTDRLKKIIEKINPANLECVSKSINLSES